MYTRQGSTVSTMQCLEGRTQEAGQSWVQGLPGLHSKTLSQKITERKVVMMLLVHMQLQLGEEILRFQVPISSFYQSRVAE